MRDPGNNCIFYKTISILKVLLLYKIRYMVLRGCGERGDFSESQIWATKHDFEVDLWWQGLQQPLPGAFFFCLALLPADAIFIEELEIKSPFTKLQQQSRSGKLK